MSKRLSPAAIVALKEALCAVYWYKADLRSFLQQCLANPQLVAQLDWSQTSYKRQIVSDLVDTLSSKNETYIAELTRLCHEVCSIKQFPHLEQLEGGREKAARAKAAVGQLAALLEPHEEIKKEQDDIADRQKRMSEKLRANTAVRQKLEDIKNRYMALLFHLTRKHEASNLSE
jgi:hypothetical protein